MIICTWTQATHSFSLWKFSFTFHRSLLWYHSLLSSGFICPMAESHQIHDHHHPWMGVVPKPPLETKFSERGTSILLPRCWTSLMRFQSKLMTKISSCGNSKLKLQLKPPRFHRYAVNLQIPLKLAFDADCGLGIVNEAYQQWEQQDQMLFSRLLFSLSKSILTRVVCTQSWQVWDTNHTYFHLHM